ncbi:MAG: XTP/dITP diphosphatase [Turicibacter sp.]|jgi:XTP/dITP diphosphohydrolase|uniref:XTP/dITP diphosphatase n=1 Tax=unclassified Turicibacter TaxID=2638206 RepID=UPI002170FEB4|nr:MULTISPECIES: XTP/dITP diphosphatase [unclassified Turicibacter]MCI9350943.1 XTP/dITP diphosphatase [Turicibacter sp.]MCU7205099.1 XTP/dITP diphosphatase [Turicibacter sp. TA25]MCU7208344.1 XTP/dITP diphosphatase [Turicibacter sp. 1E2]
MKEIIIATKNAGKAKEFEHIFKPYNVRVKSLLDFEEMDDIVEDGKTFEANALIKARAIANQFNQMVLADDSGLEVDALDGRPGVYSARYAGEGRNDEDNILKVLHELEGVPTDERGARFVCALAIVTPQGDEVVVRGTCEGRILTECLGTEGFGYDPIFYLPHLSKTMAQLPKSEKNVLSHRADAFVKLQPYLEKLL